MRFSNFLGVGILLFSGLLSAEADVLSKPMTIEVYRSAGCGCCGKWLAHLKANQFNVVDHVLENVDSVKKRYAVSAELASCHTALINGYVVEGHVPAADIKKLLAEKPKVLGISVPGMPMGTPGMEMGSNADAYEVLSFDQDQKTQVFNHYEAK
jgi:hypothetical protein